MNRTSFTRANGTTGETASVNFEADSAGATLTQLPDATVVRAEGAETVTNYIVTDDAGYSTTGDDVFFADPNDTRSYWLGGGTGSLTLLGGDRALFLARENGSRLLELDMYDRYVNYRHTAVSVFGFACRAGISLLNQKAAYHHERITFRQIVQFRPKHL